MHLGPKMILVIFNNHNLGIWCFEENVCRNKMRKQEEDERKVPNFKLSMVDSIGDLILIFGLNLSIGSPYYQGGHIRMNFGLSKCFIWDDILERKHSQKSLSTKFLHCAGWSGRTVSAVLHKSGWSGSSPDDPDLVTWERLEESQAGWSGDTPDDPDLGNSVCV